MSRLFDTIVMVDWSATASPTSATNQENAIWWRVARDGAVEPPEHARTRHDAMERLKALLLAEVEAGRRTLAGFDFPFGWPAGVAETVTGRAEALALWQWLAEEVRDGRDNSNNRFEVAERMNGFFPGIGPFWGKTDADRWPGVPYGAKERTPRERPRDRRLQEGRARSASSCFQLAFTGSVGSQALLGVAALERLKRDPELAGRVAVWPFETGLEAPEGVVTLAEIYPSLLRRIIAAARRENEPLDAAQVRVCALTFAALDAEGALAPLFRGPDDLDEAQRALVAREEGWMLGGGFEPVLQEAARRALHRAPPPAATAPPAAPPLWNDCFALPPGVEWTPVEDALARLRGGARCVVEAETVPLAEAGGRWLAEDAVARRAHPPAANAAVDGYAFAHAALPEAGEARLRLAPGRAAAGRPWSGRLEAGAALRVLTGADLPEGADTVAMDEDVAAAEGVAALRAGLRRGANVRRAGENLAEGAVAAKAGARLEPTELAQMAAGGLGSARVRRRLRVGVLSTGDELLEPGAEPCPGGVYDSNRPMLLETLRRLGFDPVDLGVAPDRAEAVRAALDAGAAQADAILASGGASAGDEDHVSRLLAAEGSLTAWRIAMKPGRPLALAVWRGRPVFGLPGNPVAAFVCALLFARPVLTVMAGGVWPEPRALTLPAAFSKRKKAGRREWLRARLTAEGAAETYRSEGSGLIGGLVWAEGLVELPDGACEIAPGDPVRFLPWAGFGL